MMAFTSSCANTSRMRKPSVSPGEMNSSACRSLDASVDQHSPIAPPPARSLDCAANVPALDGAARAGAPSCSGASMAWGGRAPCVLSVRGWQNPTTPKQPTNARHTYDSHLSATAPGVGVWGLGGLF
jgi:hypothetical protein